LIQRGVGIPLAWFNEFRQGQLGGDNRKNDDLVIGKVGFVLNAAADFPRLVIIEIEVLRVRRKLASGRDTRRIDVRCAVSYVTMLLSVSGLLSDELIVPAACQNFFGRLN
jgi:hypothetical protein